MKLLLVCYAGMSTSMLAQRLVDEGKKRDLEVEVQAVPLTELEENLDGVSAVLLGPQVRFAEKDVRDTIGGNVPMMVLSPQDFGMMRADAVLAQVLDLIG